MRTTLLSMLLAVALLPTASPSSVVGPVFVAVPTFITAPMTIVPPGPVIVASTPNPFSPPISEITLSPAPVIVIMTGHEGGTGGAGVTF